jgi:hypothetical protein
MPTVRKIVRDSAKDNYKFSSIVMGIVKSTAFQSQRAPVPVGAVYDRPFLVDSAKDARS